MICNIQKVETKRKYCIFKMSGDSRWAVVGKRIYGTGMEAFEIYKDDDLQYTLKQTNIIKQFISTVPLIGCFYTNPSTFIAMMKNVVMLILKYCFLGKGYSRFTLKASAIA